MNESDLELYGIVGKMFREIREEKGNTLETVSDYLGIAPKSLQRYECGERKIKIEIIKSLCTFYHVDCSSFMKEAKKRFISNDEIKKSQLSTVKSDFILSELEKQIIIEYRKTDEIGRAVVLRSLGIVEENTDSKKSEPRVG